MSSVIQENHSAYNDVKGNTAEKQFPVNSVSGICQTGK